MRIFILAIGLLGICNLSYGFEPVELENRQIIDSFHQPFQLKSGDTVRLNGKYSYNSKGEKELLVYLLESHVISLESEQLVLIGRDVDDNGLIDTWYFLNENGSVNYMIKPLTKDHDFAHIKIVLDHFFDVDGRWLLSIVGKYAFENLTITGGEEYSFWADYEARQIDIIDMSLRVERLLKANPNDASLLVFQKMSQEAWAKLHEDFVNHDGQERLKMVGADVAMFLAGGLAAKGLVWVGRAAISKLGLNKLINSAGKMAEEHYTHLKARVTESHKKVKVKISSKFSGEGAAVGPILARIWSAGIAERPALIISDLVFKSRIGQIVAKNFTYFVEGLKEIYQTKGYILFSASIQLSTEAIMRGYFSYSDVPVILNEPVKTSEEIIKKIGSDKELVQNLAYLTTETAVISGVSKVLELKGVPLAKRFVICGLVSTMNSFIMGKVVKDEVNVKRMAGDTAWEVVVGNSQVIFDLWQWEKWKNFANSVGKPQLKLVGVLITFVHQATGYFYYSKWSELLEGKNHVGDDAPGNKIPAPINNQNSLLTSAPVLNSDKINPEDWKPVLVPVYAPAAN
jgi:hypothetical protein